MGIASPLALLLTGRTYWRQEATCSEDEQRAMPERSGRQKEGSAHTFQFSCLKLVTFQAIGKAEYRS